MNQYVRMKTCTGKRAFAAEQLAKKAIGPTITDPKHLTIYKCPFCRLYHLGHLKQTVVNG